MDPPKEEKYSSSEIFSDAKYVAGAAKSALGNQSEKIDKAEAADATGDLLDAAGQYAKLDDQKGVGQYVDKAADYLHQYKPEVAGGAAAKPDQEQPKAEESKAAGIAGVAKKGLGGFFS